MTGNNNGEYTGIVIVLTGMAVMGIFLYALFAFAAFALTIVAFFAWRKPIQLFGDTLSPREARQFVRCGVIGMCVLPIFATFCTAMLEVQIEDEYWLHLLVGGYTLGSLGSAYIEAQTKEKQEASAQQAALTQTLTIEAQATRRGPSERMPPVPQRTKAAPGHDEQPAFRFASWDDEEELNR